MSATRYGYNVKVVDTAKGFYGPLSDMNGPVVLYPKAQGVLSRMGLIDSISDNAISLGSPVITVPSSRIIIGGHEAPSMPSLMVVDSSVLRNALCSSEANSDLPELVIEERAALNKITDSFSGLTPSDPMAELEFVDGSREETHLVIGADGQYSPLRMTVAQSSRNGKQNYSLRKSMTGTLENLSADDLKALFPPLKDGSQALFTNEGKPRFFQSVGIRARIGAVPYLAAGSSTDGNAKFNLQFFVVWTDAGVTTEWVQPFDHVWGTHDADLVGFATEALRLGFGEGHPIGQALLARVAAERTPLYEQFSAWDQYPLGSLGRTAFLGSARRCVPHSMLQEQSVGIEDAWEVGHLAGGWPDVATPLYVAAKKKEVLVRQPLAVRLANAQTSSKERLQPSEMIPWQFQFLTQGGLALMQKTVMAFSSSSAHAKTATTFINHAEGLWPLPDAQSNYQWPKDPRSGAGRLE